MLAQQPEELSGWKAIAARLGVAVRTAQDYERNFGLPVRRQPGERGRVYAVAAELDAWRGQQAINDLPSPTGEPQVPSPAGKKLRWAAAMALFLALLALIGGAFLVRSHGRQLTDFRVAGRNVIALDDNGQELWRHPFEVPLLETAYGQDGRLRRSWLGDLVGDGRQQLLLNVAPANVNDVGTYVLCFRESGKVKWQFTPGRPVSAQGGDRLLPPYNSDAVHVIFGKTPADTRIAVSSHHYIEYAHQVAFLNTDGKVIGEYWHSGHLLHSAVVDLDHDGRKELVLAGVDNGNHRATLVVLDPLRMNGLVTPAGLDDRRFELLGMSPAKERVVVLFPRSCISAGQNYTRAWGLRVTRDRLVIDVAEGVAETESPALVYELDYSLNVIGVTPGSAKVAELHRALEAKGLVDHPFSQELERLKAGVIVRRN